MNIYVCDDDSFERKTTVDILDHYCREEKIPVKVTAFESGRSMFEYSQSHDGGKGADILLMDIEMKEENGIEIVARVNQVWPDCQVIYLTNYLSYSLDVYDTKHVYYVLKDQLKSRLPEVLKKAVERFKTARSTIFFHTVNNEKIRIRLDQILYLERRIRITVVHLEETQLQIRDKLSDLMHLLPAWEFSRCHNSFIVNLAKVKKKTGQTYLLENGEEIPISRKYRAETTDSFLYYSNFMMP